MKNIYFTIIISLLVLLAASCGGGPDPEPEYGSVTFNLTAKVAGQDIAMNQSFNDQAGGRMKFDQFKFYLSRLELIQEDNSGYPLQLVDLLDFSSAPSYSVTFHNIPAGNYKGLRFGLGLDDSLNALDPSTFGSSHPLSSLTNMYWSWSSKYIFVKLDGYGDSDLSGSFTTFIYHTGLDSLYRELSFTDQPFTLANEQTVVTSFSLDFQDVFYNPSDTIRFWDVNENFTHTTGDFPLAQRFQNNVAAAIKQN
ncbi:MAG: hypothetical protein H6581_30375 [Bacteroidia bacterium]|nr:hypothetical protein [Bacteroidia bacterium]